MKQAKTTTGLDRTQYPAQSASLSNFEALESDLQILFERIMEMSRSIWYVNLENKKDGYLNELWQNEALPVFMEILSLNLERWEKEFIHHANLSSQKRINTQLKEKIENWYTRLENYSALYLLEDSSVSVHPFQRMVEQLKKSLHSSLQKIKRLIKDNADLLRQTAEEDTPPSIHCEQTFNNEEFYIFLMAIKKTQEAVPYYLDQLLAAGTLDPSLSVILVFLRNYQSIVTRFNRRWEQLPVFYIDEVLKIKLQKARPDNTWLSFQKNPGKGFVKIKKGTGFIAAENPDGSKLCYCSVEDIHVTNARLCRLTALYEERVPQLFPEGRLRDTDNLPYITSVKFKELNFHPHSEPQELFGDKGNKSSFVSLGIMLESTLLLLREGVRDGTLKMYLAPESLANFKHMLEQACAPEKTEEKKIQLRNKLLYNAFCLKISTVLGWLHVPCRLSFHEEEGCLKLNFRLNEDFPSTAPCNEELHEMSTAMPALQIVMNKDAWMFPCSWALKTLIKRFTLHVKVKHLTSLQVYGETGAADITAPFSPFGMEAKRNSWMAFGNYEMSIKPLSRVIFHCRWQQLPLDENGFEGHYREYKKKINNHSFRVRVEWLNNRQWESTASPLYLFDSQGPASQVKDESAFLFNFKGRFIPGLYPEEAYRYGVVSNGFLRLVLDSPEWGFGHALYRELFAQTMMQNSRLKKYLPLPKEPVSPLMSEINLSYEAMAEYIPESMANQTIKLYHIRPLSGTMAFPVKPGKAVPLVQHTHSSANLLFGFKEAEGCERIRLYMDFTPRIEKTLSDKEEDLPKIFWYFFDGVRWNAIFSDRIHKDTTEGFTNSGEVELLLPFPVKEEYLDKEGCFWIWAAVRKNHHKCQCLQGVYMNTVQVVANGGDGTALPTATITEAEKSLPGILSVEQIFPGFGGYPAETIPERNIRIAYRISHRNRLVAPIDYERMVMTAFSSVDKVKCFSGSEKNRASVILAVMQKQGAGELPLCSYPLLREIKNYLRVYMPPMAELSVINPVYEEVMIRCHIRLHPTALENETRERLERKLDHYIAPWMDTGEMPDFDEKFSMDGLYTILINDEGVELIRNISLLFVAYREDGTYVLKEYPVGPGHASDIRMLQPWSVIIPSGNHLITFLHEPKEAESVGIGELTIGNTFIIKE